MMKQSLIYAGVAAISFFVRANAFAQDTPAESDLQGAAVALVGVDGVAAIAVDDQDYPLVRLATGLFSDDVERVTGKRPKVTGDVAGAPQMVIAGTLGHSALIDRLAADGKLKGLEKLKGGWETTLCQVVDRPADGVGRALVVVGSDRRGTAYGLMRLSERIGVSPWYWWADVPTVRRPTLSLAVPASETDAPAVKYRGIFINDEDWGLHQWAKQTFEPAAGGIGPKTYEKVFELMLRLRLNYVWPAMHAVSPEFHTIPENVALADRYGIVAGASHCEPMLYNNVHWNPKTQGAWNYLTNRDPIFAAWESQSKKRGGTEAVWGLGIRGIHDQGMQGPREIPARIDILNRVIQDQQALIDKNVTKQWGPVARAFVPYKEVLPLYDAGLRVPDEATIVWVDDNFGYIRRLGKPEERKRAGGAGVYWHLSYYGNPHSYTWINTTAPALMWEELHKAWENDARTLWVVNVGDIKPMEIGIDYFARLAWNPDALPAGGQPQFLLRFAADNFGNAAAKPVADLLTEFYRLGTIRKPELMVRAWALALTDQEAARLRDAYEALLANEERLAAALPAEVRDAYFETVGYPARVLGTAGLIFMADRAVRLGDHVEINQDRITRLRESLDRLTGRYNDAIAAGKWKHMMPGPVTGKNLMAWNSQVRWPWGEKPGTPATKPALADRPVSVWRDAALADRLTAAGKARWVPVPGLGQSGRAVVLKPAGAGSAFDENGAAAPRLEFDFDGPAADGQEALVDFLPTFRLYPGVQLRVAVTVDDTAPALVEVPGSNGKEDENGPNRRDGIQNNFVRARVPLPALSAGRHVLKIAAVDPGVVIDRVSLPAKQ